MTDLDKIAIMLEAGSPECACMKCEECPGVHVPADERVDKDNRKVEPLEEK